jgi:hypothetical protein
MVAKVQALRSPIQHKIILVLGIGRGRVVDIRVLTAGSINESDKANLISVRAGVRFFVVTTDLARAAVSCDLHMRKRQGWLVELLPNERLSIVRRPRLPITAASSEAHKEKSRYPSHHSAPDWQWTDSSFSFLKNA